MAADSADKSKRTGRKPIFQKEFPVVEPFVGSSKHGLAVLFHYPALSSYY
jgi:hypothetical protein